MLTVQNFKPKLQKENYTNSHNFDLFSTTIPINSFFKKWNRYAKHKKTYIKLFLFLNFPPPEANQAPIFQGSHHENVAATIARALIGQAFIETIFNQRIL